MSRVLKVLDEILYKYEGIPPQGFDDGGRVNFANGSEAKKIDAYTQAKTDFKGKVWDTIEEAVESNKICSCVRVMPNSSGLINPLTVCIFPFVPDIVITLFI